MDIYADEMTTYSELRPMLNVKCANEEIEAVLRVLFDNVLNVKYNLFGWARTMCKYGDFFLFLDIDDKFGEWIQQTQITYSTSGTQVE